MKRILAYLLIAAALAVLLMPARGGVVSGTHDHMGMGPMVDMSMIPAPVAGFPEVRTRRTVEVAPLSNIGDFRTVCTPSHFAFDDPIVWPNQPGKSHLHTFFGNTGANAASTYASLLASGNSTCRGGILNRSAYWVPSMVDTRDGRPIAPINALIYYKQGYGGLQPEQINIPPHGLRMIAGSAKNDRDLKTFPWTFTPYSFQCMDVTLGYGVVVSQSIPVCPKPVSGKPEDMQLWAVVIFPQCWNGRDLDSLDHKSHMAYPGDGRCPESHPVALPEISFQVIYAVPPDAASLKRWRLSSDMYADTKVDVTGATVPVPGGYSMHADWFDGWGPAAKQAWTEGCLRVRRDCHAHLLGNGLEIF